MNHWIWHERSKSFKLFFCVTITPNYPIKVCLRNTLFQQQQKHDTAPIEKQRISYFCIALVGNKVGYHPPTTHDFLTFDILLHKKS